MAHRVLELTLVSAYNLKDVNVFSRMEVYGVVSVSGDPRTRQRTKTDRDGARHPRWEETLSFTVPATAAASGAGRLHVLLRTVRLFSFCGDGDVGEVFIPLAALLAGACVCGAATMGKCETFQVRKVHGNQGRGMLNVSYRFGRVVGPHLPSNPPPCQQCYTPSIPRTLPVPKPGARGGAAAASTATKNVRKNDSYKLVGVGVGLPDGGFGVMRFGDMDRPAYVDAGHWAAAANAGGLAV